MFLFIYFFLLRKAYTSAASKLKMYAICAHCPINGTASARIDPDEIQQNAASHQGLHYLLSLRPTQQKESLINSNNQIKKTKTKKHTNILVAQIAPYNKII